MGKKKKEVVRHPFKLERVLSSAEKTQHMRRLERVNAHSPLHKAALDEGVYEASNRLNRITPAVVVSACTGHKREGGKSKRGYIELRLDGFLARYFETDIVVKLQLKGWRPKRTWFLMYQPNGDPISLPFHQIWFEEGDFEEVVDLLFKELLKGEMSKKTMLAGLGAVGAVGAGGYGYQGTNTRKEKRS